MSGDEPERKWRLWQVESTIGCNIDCIMCPWKNARTGKETASVLLPSVWESLRPHLTQVDAIDFSGGGEPLVCPQLTALIQDAKSAGCETGFLTNGLLMDPGMADRLIDIGVNWIAVSMDGATAETYESIRRGGRFSKVCANVTHLACRRRDRFPKLAINFVIMTVNVHELEDLVRLAADIGVDQVNFKQCDVIRGDAGNGFGLYGEKETKAIRRLKKRLSKARRLARRLKLETTAFPFTPDEQPVCVQNPLQSLFVRHDGMVSPCINLAYGGQSRFFNRPAELPTVQYGRLPRDNLLDLWQSGVCVGYRKRFQERLNAHDAVIINSAFEPSWPKLQETLQAAQNAMPKAPPGCEVCHYLYNV